MIMQDSKISIFQTAMAMHIHSLDSRLAQLLFTYSTVPIPWVFFFFFSPDGIVALLVEHV